MNLNKKELIISVILMLVLALLIIGFNANVLATSSNTAGGLNEYLNGWYTGNNSNNNVPQIPINNTNNTNNEAQNIPVNNSVNNSNTNTPGQVPNTGLEDAPWLIIGICVISAVFAYKKIKEYRID